MDTISIVILASFLAVGLFIIYWFKIKKRDRTLHWITNRLVGKGIDPDRYIKNVKEYSTPKGARVLSTVPIPAEFMTAYDEEIEHVIRNHTRKYPHWKAVVTQFPVVFCEPMTTNQETEPGSPALLVHGIQTAGTVIGTADTHIKPGWLLIPHQANQGWKFMNYWRASVYNEGEHLMENINDKEVFLQYVGGSDSHPHVADELPTGASGFSSVSKVSPPCAGAL